MRQWKNMNYVVFVIILLAMAARSSLSSRTGNGSNGQHSIQQTANNGKIYDINTNLKLYEKRVLQLEVNWRDNLPNETSYNVIVNALNRTQCPDMPCSLYGISKSKKGQNLTIPENPISYVDVMECNYMFGCSYDIIVETSNAKISNHKQFAIPYCVLNVCSCRHAANLPKVEIFADMPQNDTINFNWSITWSDGAFGKLSKQELDKQMALIKLYKIYLRINEQTNPSLSWGGALIPIVEEVFFLQNLSYTIKNKTFEGQVKLKTSQPMSSKAVLNLHSYIEDDLKCPGPTNLIKMKVPTFNEAHAELIKETVDVHRIWIVTTLVFICVIISVLFFIRRRKRQQASKSELEKEEHQMSPLANIRMEDNLNYVDKYVEEAQAKGLADIFELPHQAIELGMEIGEGAFGRVYKAIAINLYRTRGTTTVAVKQLKTNPTADEVSEFLFEIEMLKSVGRHENIVSFLGCCTIRAPYLMVMEYVGRGDLLTYLRTVRQYASRSKPLNANCVSHKPAQEITQAQTQAPVNYIELTRSTQSKQSVLSTQSIDSDAEVEKQPKPSLSETTYTLIEDEQEFEYILSHRELHNFALQIANGMRFLEHQEITHRDLAARNVLIDERKTLKISDFGLSRHGIYTNTKTRKLPLRWLSIESICDNVYSSKSDVWAYGVVLWEIGTLGASPYPTISNHELIPFLLDGKRLDKPEVCTQQVYEIMLKCWNEDPEERPTFEQLYKTLSPKTTYVDINSLSDDYVFPPIQGNDDTSLNR